MSALTLSYPSFAPATKIISSQVNQNGLDVTTWANGNIGVDNFATLTGVVTWSVSSNVLAQSISSSSTSGIIEAASTGVLASTKSIAKFSSASAQTTGRAAVVIELTSGSSTIPALEVKNAGTGAGVYSQSTGTGSLFKGGDASNTHLEFEYDGYAKSLNAPELGNYIGNGAMDLWQRGTSFTSTSSSKYAADRFKYVIIATGGVVSLLRSTDVPTLAESGFQSSYSYHVDCTTVDAAVAAGDGVHVVHTIEGYDYAALKGKQVTLSFWVKATKTGTYCVAFRNNGSDRSYVAEYTVSSSGTWEKKTVTLTLNPTAGTDDYTTGAGLQISWTLLGGSTFQTTAGSWQTGNFIATSSQVNALDNTSNDFRLAQVQLCLGAKARPFRRAGITIDREIALCQRYYEKSYGLTVDPGTSSDFSGTSTIIGVDTNSANNSSHQYKVRKRISVTPTLYNPSTGTSNSVRKDVDASNITITGINASTVNDRGWNSVSSSAAFVGAALYSYHWAADADF